MTLETDKTVKLTSAELSQLWTSYMNDSMTICVFKYFLEKVEDTETRSILTYALDTVQARIRQLTVIFKEDDQPVPHGFNDNDVNVTAPRLFSDIFILNNIKQTSHLGLVMNAQAVTLSARSDMRDYFFQCLSEANTLHDKTVNLLLSKGLYVRAPYISTPKQVDYVTEQNFLSGWFGKQRPLLSLEIANLYQNVQRNALGFSLLMGYGQVANSKKIAQYMIRGKDISSKHLEIFSSVLRESDIPSALPWDTAVTDSTIAPFSDKLMLFQATAMNALGIAYYGTSMSTSVRHDISAHYARLMAEIGKYAEDGANLMIENGWLEEPPRAIDHKQLAGV
jgi:hypothetical protein